MSRQQPVPGPGGTRWSPYADAGPRRVAQVTVDALVLVWVALWVWVGTVVHDAVAALAAPGRRVESGAGGLADDLRGAGETAGGVPLVGDELRGPLERAGGQADELAQAGASFADHVLDAALLLGIVTAAVPVLLVVGVWLLLRLRSARRAVAARRLLAAGTDLELFALRALVSQPLPVLARVDRDPAGAWRRGDPVVVWRLAALELREAGVTPPPARSSSP